MNLIHKQAPLIANNVGKSTRLNLGGWVNDQSKSILFSQAVLQDKIRLGEDTEEGLGMRNNGARHQPHECGEHLKTLHSEVQLLTTSFTRMASLRKAWVIACIRINS